MNFSLVLQSAFRYESDVPLVVPEINGECTKGSKLIANPNCTTAIGLMALWPLHKLFKLKKVLMSVSLLFIIFKIESNYLFTMTVIPRVDLPSCFWSRTTRHG